MINVGQARVASRAAARLCMFVEMSAVLTGLPEIELDPAFDRLDLKRIYLDTADEMAGEALVDTLLAKFAGLSGAGHAQIAGMLLEAGREVPSATAKLAEAIVNLWLLGAWYPNAGSDQGEASVAAPPEFHGRAPRSGRQTRLRSYGERSIGSRYLTGRAARAGVR